MTDEIHEDVGIITEINGDEVIVEIVPTGACDSCSISGVCGGKNKKVIHKIKTDLELEVGGKVKIEISSGLRVMSSIILFLFPILSMVVFYLGSKVLGLSEEISIGLSFAGLLLSGVVLKIVDKKLGSKLQAKIVQVL